VKVSEISGGAPATVRLKSESGPFVMGREEEVSLVASADAVLLSCAAGVWSVRGISKSDTKVLADVVGSGLPMVAFAAQVGGDRLVVEARRFTHELRLTEPMQLGMDEKDLDDVRRGHGVGGSPSDVAAWLEDRLFAPAALGGTPTGRRLVISGERAKLDAFRIHGLKVSADVQRVDEKLLIKRVVRGGGHDSARLMLLHAAVSIVDATLAAEALGAVRTALSQAVADQDSYLRSWQEYHGMEHAFVLRRARAFGAVGYTKAERRRDGGWRFHLEPVEDLADRLTALGEWDRFELEAGQQPPNHLEDLQVGSAPALAARAKDSVSGPVAHVDVTRNVVDLAAPDDDEDVASRPPRAGYVYLATGGDKARLRRRTDAEVALRTGTCPLPQLGLLIEGRPVPAARRGSVSVSGPVLKAALFEAFGAHRPTARQLEAIEYALNTPEVVLIQGPPGTGKTKVITAIQSCLAALAEEGLEASHSVLATAAQHDAVENVAQRTEVFGLPAVKIGRRRGADRGPDSTHGWLEERMELIRSRMKEPPDAERLWRARNLAVACMRARSLPAEQAARLRELVGALGDLVPPSLRGEVMARAAELTRPAHAVDPEEADLRVKAARAVRVDAGPFSDDGPVRARVALSRLHDVLTPDERSFLERCATADPDPAPPWLAEGKRLRDALIDRLTERPASAELVVDDASQRLLLEVLDTVNRRSASARRGDEAVLADYLHDLEADPEGARAALARYTVVLAATLQQAAGKAMRNVMEVGRGQMPKFESVIVDEAARANPLDLFIPMSMAKRRVVLVGDHRQLPHLLEPDVDRELEVGVGEGTVAQQTLDAVHASLFERLWVRLRALEHADGIRRTVTLNAQFRMHPTLGAFVSREFYEVHDDGAIESPRPGKHFSHDLPDYQTDDGPAVAAWLDVPRARGPEVRGASKSRPAEAWLIAKEVRRLIDHDPGLTFGVIAFYRAQVDAIGHAMIAEGLTERGPDGRGWRVAERWATTLDHAGKRVERLRVGTVDAFQGKEFDVVFLSVTRSNDLPGATDEQQRAKFGHLMLENRLCVAMSRQQRLLVAVGDRAFVTAEDARDSLRALRAFADLCGGSYGVVR
jgi:hypothetical protein